MLDRLGFEVPKENKYRLLILYWFPSRYRSPKVLEYGTPKPRQLVQKNHKIEINQDC